MKNLKNGFTTGSCAAAAALASVLWQKNGICPEMVEIETPSGILFCAKIIPFQSFLCGVKKDSGDDPDKTNGCIVCAEVKIMKIPEKICFHAGDGIGIITKKGLKIPVGEPAINPVPRKMIENAIRPVIGSLGADVTISIPDGEKIAEHTFNSRLGIVGGLSILGTTGIVRPMSEEAVKDSLKLELSMYSANGENACAFTTGYSGENFLRKNFPYGGSILLCSNYLGYMLDCAEEMNFRYILLAGGTGKLIKPAAGIMNLHSHIAGGQREIICTHAALCGADINQLQQLYNSVTTKHSAELLEKFGIASEVWASIAESAVENCIKRVHKNIRIAMILIDENKKILAKTKDIDDIIQKWEKINI